MLLDIWNFFLGLFGQNASKKPSQPLPELFWELREEIFAAQFEPGPDEHVNRAKHRAFRAMQLVLTQVEQETYLAERSYLLHEQARRFGNYVVIEGVGRNDQNLIAFYASWRDKLTELKEALH
jgi:hypothetical protein